LGGGRGRGFFYTSLHSLAIGLGRKICTKERVFSSNSSNGAIIERLFLPGRVSNRLFLSCPGNDATWTFLEHDGNDLLGFLPR